MTRLARVLDGDMRELRRLHPTQQSVDDRVAPLLESLRSLDEAKPMLGLRAWVLPVEQSI